MKKLVCVCLSFLFMFSLTAFAEVDLSGMSFDELSALRDEALKAMMALDEWQSVEVPAGTYEIGVEIPAGHWNISAAGDQFINLEWGPDLEDGGVQISYLSIYDQVFLSLKDGKYAAMYEQDTVSWKLTEGSYLRIEGGSVVFTPYTGASFSFK